jgi:REP element-mobilizing transposase RayT
VAHRARAAHDPRCPVHVTLRACAELPSFRIGHAFASIRSALAVSSSRSFRLLHFSVQADHVHLLIEADGRTAFRRGIQGLAIRVAKSINRTLGRRGRVWADRFHARRLATPREVRHALVYVLANWRKHIPGARGFDDRSSARWFEGWRTGCTAPVAGSPVVAASTWLARIGWRRYGLIDVDEAPRSRRRMPERRQLGDRSVRLR